MRRWLAKRFPHAPLHRVAAIDVDDDGFQCTRSSRLRDGSRWSDLTRVSIRTTDKGPFDEDVFIVLETSACSWWVPQSADGAAELLFRLQQLDGFNSELVIEAMSCTDNHEFICWELESST